MKKITSILLLITTLLSCSDGGSNAVVSVGQAFYILDKDGNDLLDQKTENAIDITQIKIYYLINGSKIEYSKYLSSLNSNASYDNTKGFNILKPEEYKGNKYLIGVALSAETDRGDVAYTFIEWDKDHTDTIRSRVWKTENSQISRMTAYNDSLWSAKENDMVFTIVK